MMDYIAGLVQRGLISPDVAQGLVQQVADLKQRPFETGGGAPTNMVFTPRSAGQTVQPNAKWIPRNQLDQGQNYNPQTVPDEPIVEKLPPQVPAGSAPNYQQKKDYRLRQGDNLKDYKKAYRERQKSGAETE